MCYTHKRPNNETTGGEQVQTNLLKAKMVANDVSRAFLASQLGISANTLSYKLCGHRPFDVDEVVKLCEVLNITDPAEKAQIFLT